MHPLGLKLHRYFGLAIGIFILIAGLTGSILAFYHPLDRIINPWQISVKPSPQVPISDVLDHIALIEEKVKDARVSWVSLSLTHQSSWLYFLEGTHRLKFPAFNEVYINPYTQEITGMRLWGDISAGISNLLPFIYHVHYALALGPFGKEMMGFIAFFWVLALLVGVWITLPKWRTKNFFTQWRKAWKWRFGRSVHAKNYHWHKTGGLWLLLIMLILAWSSMALNLPKLNQKMLGNFMSFQEEHGRIKELKKPLLNPKLSWREAREKGRELMAALALKEQFTILEESSLMYEMHQGIYAYTVKSSLDISQEYGATRVYLDANSGVYRASFLPTHKASGDTVTQWLYGLHQGTLWGISHKIVLCFLGTITAFFVLSGFYLWWKKRVTLSKKESENELLAG